MVTCAYRGRFVEHFVNREGVSPMGMYSLSLRSRFSLETSFIAVQDALDGQARPRSHQHVN